MTALATPLFINTHQALPTPLNLTSILAPRHPSEPRERLLAFSPSIRGAPYSGHTARQFRADAAKAIEWTRPPMATICGDSTKAAHLTADGDDHPSSAAQHLDRPSTHADGIPLLRAFRLPVYSVPWSRLGPLTAKEPDWTQWESTSSSGALDTKAQLDAAGKLRVGGSRAVSGRVRSAAVQACVLREWHMCVLPHPENVRPNPDPVREPLRGQDRVGN